MCTRDSLVCQVECTVNIQVLCHSIKHTRERICSWHKIGQSVSACIPFQNWMLKWTSKLLNKYLQTFANLMFIQWWSNHYELWCNSHSMHMDIYSQWNSEWVQQHRSYSNASTFTYREQHAQYVYVESAAHSVCNALTANTLHHAVCSHTILFQANKLHILLHEDVSTQICKLHISETFDRPNYEWYSIYNTK